MMDTNIYHTYTKFTVKLFISINYYHNQLEYYIIKVNSVMYCYYYYYSFVSFVRVYIIVY